MKLKFLILSLIILCTGILNDATIQEDKTSILCSGKWYISSMQSGEMTIEVPDDKRDNMWMNFFKDGKHEVMASGNIKKGSWKFSKNKDSLVFNTQGGEIKYMKLRGLNKKELKLTFVDGGEKINISLDQNK
tara:strand:- start:4792 stop:5187 length:396 start_codon:yes stop_codon:yes gene_type:complete